MLQKKAKLSRQRNINMKKILLAIALVMLAFSSTPAFAGHHEDDRIAFKLDKSGRHDALMTITNVDLGDEGHHHKRNR